MHLFPLINDWLLSKWLSIFNSNKDILMLILKVKFAFILQIKCFPVHLQANLKPVKICGILEALCSHCSILVQKRTAASVSVKILTLISTKRLKKWRLSKALSKVDIHKNGGFENTLDQLKHKKTDAFPPLFCV